MRTAPSPSDPIPAPFSSLAGVAPASTWRQALSRASAATGSSSDARWLIEEVAGVSGARLWSMLDQPAPIEALGRLWQLLERRMKGEPVAYLLGHWPFRFVDLAVGPGALVPRPETEQVADVALSWLASNCTGARMVADLGTGTGALALAIASEDQDATVVAVDVSEEALAWAEKNRTRTAEPSSRVQLLAGSWYEALPTDLLGRFDLIVSNPPYVSAAELSLLATEVRCHEPAMALVSGEDGLQATRELLQGAPAWLRPGGCVVMEMASQRAAETLELARRSGLVEVECVADLAGRPRVLKAQRSR